MSIRGGRKGLKIDARRDQEQILATARTLLPEHGPDFPMEELARAAGIGVGALYRRFGGREQLIDAITEDAFQSVMANAEAASAVTDAWQALTAFITASIPDLKVVNCLSIWYPDARSDVRTTLAEHRRRQALLDVMEPLIGWAQSAGQVRGDVTVTDLETMLALMLRPVPGQPESPEETRRYVLLMLDGFRAR